MTKIPTPIINDFLAILVKIKNIYNVEVSEICISFPEFQAEFKEPFIDYLKENFVLLTKIEDLKKPGSAIILKLGTQYGLQLSDVEKNFPGFVVAVGMSLHSHVYGGLVLIDFDERQKMAF